MNKTAGTLTYRPAIYLEILHCVQDDTSLKAGSWSPLEQAKACGYKRGAQAGKPVPPGLAEVRVQGKSPLTPR